MRTNHTNIINGVLNKVSADVITQKQRAIERVAQSLQYAAPPLEMLQEKNDDTEWQSPVRDAVDIFIDAMVKRARWRRQGNFYGEPEFSARAYTMNPHEWNALYRQIYV